MVRAAILSLALASTALAPCPLLAQTCPTPKPILADCTAAAPAAGQSFSGPVLQVIDGRTVCVALGPTPDQWVRVTLADARAAEARDALMAAAFARDVDCTTVRTGPDGVTAICRSDGASIADIAAPLRVRLGPAGTAGQL